MLQRKSKHAWVLLLALNGCATAPSSPLVMDIHLPAAASIYYSAHNRWPNSLDELHASIAKDSESDPSGLTFSEIPWDKLEGKVTFETLPDGKLLLTETVINQKSETNAIPIILAPPLHVPSR